jgi:hypothetical protein
MRPQLGTHIQFRDHPSYTYKPDDWIWDDVVFMTQELRKVIAHPESDLMYVYSTGDA